MRATGRLQRNIDRRGRIARGLSGVPFLAIAVPPPEFGSLIPTDRPIQARELDFAEPAPLGRRIT